MRRPYGPNTVPVDSFIARLSRLTLQEFATAIRTWRDALRRTDAWYEAEDAVGDALARTGRHDEEWRLHDRLYDVFRHSVWHADAEASRHAPGTEAAAQYIAGSAAFALMLLDVIPPAHLATLYAPFAELVPLASLGIRAPRSLTRDGRHGIDS